MSGESPAFSLTGKQVLVVGASGGIGGACAETAARLGATVLATGRRAEALDTLRPRLAGGRVETLDLENSAGWAAASAGWPALDGVVFASGVSVVRPLRVQAEAEFARVQRVNFEAPAMLVRELLRARRIADGASIVFIGSIAGRIGAPGHSAYSASKAALAGFARSLALEVAQRRVRVNTVSPGLVETEMAREMNQSLTEEQRARYVASYPLGLGKPEDVAGAVAFLLSPAARWITGTDLVIDGGVSHT